MRSTSRKLDAYRILLSLPSSVDEEIVACDRSPMTYDVSDSTLLRCPLVRWLEIGNNVDDPGIESLHVPLLFERCGQCKCDHELGAARDREASLAGQPGLQDRTCGARLASRAHPLSVSRHSESCRLAGRQHHQAQPRLQRRESSSLA